MKKRLSKKGEFQLSFAVLISILLALVLAFFLFYQISKGIPTP